MTDLVTHPIRWLDRHLERVSTLALLRIYGLILVSLTATYLIPSPDLMLLADITAVIVAWRCRREARRRDRADAEVRS